jgi:hypothetical protein
VTQPVTAKVSNVRSAQEEGRTSVYATKDVSTDENLLVVEDTQWLTLDAVEKSRIGHAVVEEPGWVQLALLLTTEANNTVSPWSSYFEDFRMNSSLPIVLWSNKDLQELRGTQVLSTALQYRCALQHSYQKYGWLGKMLQSHKYSSASSGMCSAHTKCPDDCSKWQCHWHVFCSYLCSHHCGHSACMFRSCMAAARNFLLVHEHPTTLQLSEPIRCKGAVVYVYIR